MGTKNIAKILNCPLKWEVVGYFESLMDSNCIFDVFLLINVNMISTLESGTSQIKLRKQVPLITQLHETRNITVYNENNLQTKRSVSLDETG